METCVTYGFRRWLFNNDYCPDFGDRYNITDSLYEYGISRRDYLVENEEEALMDVDDYWAPLNDNEKKAWIKGYVNHLISSINHCKSELAYFQEE